MIPYMPWVIPTMRITTDILFWYFFTINMSYVVLILCAIPLIYKRFKETQFERVERLHASETLPSVGIIITLHNEEQKAIDSLMNALNIIYPDLEVIAVNDESDNQTFPMLKETFRLRKALPMGKNEIDCAEVKGVYRSELYPNLVVVDKISRHCKGDATNAGINETNADLLAVVDADTIIERESLIRMIRPFYENRSIAGEGGTLRILNGCTIKNGRIEEIGVPSSPWAGMQVVEYLRAFLYGRLGWNLFGGPLNISGAFGFFRRDKLVEVGGYDPNSFGEDYELTTHLNKHFRAKGDKDVIGFIPDPIAWTTVPDTRKTLKKQRIRWHQGLIEVLWTYKGMFLNPKYGASGLLAYPYMLFGEFFEPIFESIGYLLVFFGIYIGLFSWWVLAKIFLLTWGTTLVLTFISVLLELTTFRRYTRSKQILKLLWFSVLENIIFRPEYLIWRYIAIYNYIFAKRDW